MNTSAILQKIISSPALHATLLGQLSFLEKSGHLKLLKYKKLHKLKDIEFLKHVSDEARHAQILKRACLLIGPTLGKMNPSSRNYIRKLEVKVLRELRTTNIDEVSALYPLVTYIIEKRAEHFYPLYERLLLDMQPNISVASIIDDEKDHLESVIQKIIKLRVPDAIIESCLNFENTLFLNFLMGLVNLTTLTLNDESFSDGSDELYP